MSLSLSLSVQVGSRETQRREDRKRIQKPTSTLFIANFDARKTREGDLEGMFAKYGKLNRCQIKRNYAFIGVGSERCEIVSTC